MKIIAIIQARMGSSRLPGKILKELGDTDVLSYVVSRCRQIKGVSEVIVATSNFVQDDCVEKWCSKNNVSCFRGSEEDVLSRYVQAAKKYEPDAVMRVTADCPFVDFHLASALVEKMQEEKTDFTKIDSKLPRGLAVELCSYQALLYINKHGKEHRHREHVTYYAYENSSEFTWSWVRANSIIQEPSLRITLDTEEDYELCKQVAEQFYGNVLVSAEDVVQFLVKNPEIAKINAHIEQKPVN